MRLKVLKKSLHMVSVINFTKWSDERTLMVVISVVKSIILEIG